MDLWLVYKTFLDRGRPSCESMHPPMKGAHSAMPPKNLNLRDLETVNGLKYAAGVNISCQLNPVGLGYRTTWRMPMHAIYPRSALSQLNAAKSTQYNKRPQPRENQYSSGAFTSSASLSASNCIAFSSPSSLSLEKAFFQYRLLIILG